MRGKEEKIEPRNDKGVRDRGRSKRKRRRRKPNWAHSSIRSACMALVLVGRNIHSRESEVNDPLLLSGQYTIVIALFISVEFSM